jgi:GT2 family glycosyltransferase
LFTVFIADTGSSEEEKELIRKNILPIGDIRLIEYDYYNFAKINNDVVKNHIKDDFEFIVFSNNDIKVLNDVIYGMLSVFKEKPNAGTVGCRLHFENNTIQHDGILAYISESNHVQISHFGLFGYYTYSNNLREVFGNTAALMMIRKKTFIKCEMFNENYQNCFEDVELNINCIVNGYSNYCDSRLVAYHYESQTRNEDPEKLKKESSDFKTILFPHIYKNFDKIKGKLSTQIMK